MRRKYKTMRKLSFIQLAAWLIMPLSVFANDDGFAGPDKELLSVSCGGENKGVRIGTVAYAEGGCFKWEPATGLEDASSGVTNASPTETTTYKLTWTKADGKVSVDHVTVTVSATLKGDPMVKAKKCCFENGEDIKVADFEFTPSGIEECVTVVTTQAGGNEIGEGKQTIEFSFKNGDAEPITLSTEINVTPAFNLTVGGGTSMADRAKKVEEIMAQAKKVVKEIKDGTEKAAKISGKTVADDNNGVQGSIDLGFEIQAYTCCKECKTDNNYGVTTTIKFTGKLGVAYQYDFPGYGIPYLASVGFTAGFASSVEGGANLSYTYFCDETKLSFPYSAAVEVNGGAYGQIGNRWVNVLRVQLTINAGASAKSAIEYKNSGWDSGWSEIKTCFDVKAVGFVKTLGIGETKVERVLFNHCM